VLSNKGKLNNCRFYLILIMAENKQKRKIPLRCKLGFHDWTTKVYHEEKGSFVEHSIKECKLCGKKIKGTRKFDWDKSK